MEVTILLDLNFLHPIGEPYQWLGPAEAQPVAAPGVVRYRLALKQDFDVVRVSDDRLQNDALLGRSSSHRATPTMRAGIDIFDAASVLRLGVSVADENIRPFELGSCDLFKVQLGSIFVQQDGFRRIVLVLTFGRKH